MKKLIVYKLWKSKGRGTLGRYFHKSCRAVLYMLAISIRAVEIGCDGDDLAKLVEYHEEAHHLQHMANAAKAWKNENPTIDEQMADEYAWRKFYKVHKRWPRMKKEDWM